MSHGQEILRIEITDRLGGTKRVNISRESDARNLLSADIRADDTVSLSLVTSIIIRAVADLLAAKEAQA